jgi:hypothetical protein
VHSQVTPFLRYKQAVVAHQLWAHTGAADPSPARRACALPARPPCTRSALHITTSGFQEGGARTSSRRMRALATSSPATCACSSASAASSSAEPGASARAPPAGSHGSAAALPLSDAVMLRPAGAPWLSHAQEPTGRARGAPCVTCKAGQTWVCVAHA